MSENNERKRCFSLKDDYAFKCILGSEKNKLLLQNFLECVLDLEHEDVEELIFLDKELKKEHIEERTHVLDIQVCLKNGTLIDVEIQRNWNRLFPERSFAYLAKMYSSNLKSGESFSRAKRCIGINIVEKGFNLTDKIHSIASFRFEETEEILTKAIEMHVLNLEKVRNLPISKGTTREECLVNWLKMINAENREDRTMLAATSPIFKLLNEKIEEVTRTPEEERVFDARMKMRSDILGEMELSYNEGFEKGIETGIETGIEKGIETGMATGAYQTRLETAKKCLDMKMPLETILELTGLKRSEIENLTRL